MVALVGLAIYCILTSKYNITIDLINYLLYLNTM